MMSAEVRSGAVMRKCDENATGFVPTPKTQFPPVTPPGPREDVAMSGSSWPLTATNEKPFTISSYDLHVTNLSRSSKSLEKIPYGSVRKNKFCAAALAACLLNPPVRGRMGQMDRSTVAARSAGRLPAGR